MNYFTCLGHLVSSAQSGLLFTFLAVVLHLQTCNELKIQKQMMWNGLLGRVRWKTDKWSGDKKSGADDRAMSTVLPLEEGCITLPHWGNVRGRTAVKENWGPHRRCQKERLDFHLTADGEHHGLWTGNSTVLLLSLSDSVLTAGKESSWGNTENCFILRSRMSYAVLRWQPTRNTWNW